MLLIELNTRSHSDDDMATVFIASNKGFKSSTLELFLVSINTRNPLTDETSST